MRFLVRLAAVLGALWAGGVFGYVAITGNKGGVDQWLAAAVALGTPIVVLVVLFAIAESRREP